MSDIQEKLEIKILEQDLIEENHFSNILNNMKYRGWYRFKIDEGFYTHIFCIFRIPPAIPLYDNVLRHFLKEERKAGLHRMLIGKDLRQEMQELLDVHGGDISETVANLNDEEVNDLMNRLDKVITFDCNKIPYLHIKKLKEDSTPKVDINRILKKHVKTLPDYLKTFYDVLNEKITVDEAKIITNGIIFNESMDTLKNGIKNYANN